MSLNRTLLLRILALLLLLYFFFLGLELMGTAFKAFGSGFSNQLIESTSNPLFGLVIGILATSLIQSSSTTTSMTVGLVAAGGLTIENAIPIVMGANIGTSITNTIVSLAHVTRKEEFQRAFAAATVHDFFNWMAVVILFPVELATGYLARTALYLEEILEGSGGLQLLNPIKTIVKPAAQMMHGLSDGSGAVTLILALVILFAALKLLVDVLKAILSAKAEAVLHRTLFRSPLHGMAAGVVITVMVQSSSITTSTAVPLVGAGAVTLRQVFPFTLGANVGTTVTAILAALSTANPAAVTVSLSHLLFNLTATSLIYPISFIRRIPLFLAEKMGELGVRSRPLALAYILLAFFGLPLLFLFLFGDLNQEKQPIETVQGAESIGGRNASPDAPSGNQ